MNSLDKLDDVKLVELMQRGNEDAFSAIFNRYWKRLISLAYSHTKDKYLAEEIVQDIFFSLWKRRDTVKIDSLSAYLATAVKFSVFKNVLHNTRRTKIIDSIKPISHSDITEESINAKFLQEYIDGIVEELPEKCRLVYIYSRHQGLSIREISQEMSISEKTAEAHLTKALKVLRLNLKEFLAVSCILHHLL